MSDRRRTFWPVVLFGVAAAGLTAYAGDQPWLTGARTPVEAATLHRPGVNALGLAALAAWGVLLVVKHVARRVVAVVIALLAGNVWLFVASPIDHRSAWPWIAGFAATATVAAAVLAFVLAPSWPEMGRKYDAPQAPAGLDTDDNAGLWRQLSEGRDPTEDRNP